MSFRYFIFVTAKDPTEDDHNALIQACKEINAMMGYKRIRREGVLHWGGFFILRGIRRPVEYVATVLPKNFVIAPAPPYLMFEHLNNCTIYGEHPFSSVRRNLNLQFDLEDMVENLVADD